MRFALRIAIGTLAGALPAIVMAQGAATPPNPCPVPFLPCTPGGLDAIVDYVINFIFPSFRVLFIAIALAMLAYNGVRLVTENDDENAQKEAKDAYKQIIYGCAIVSLATFLVDAFGTTAQDTLINPEPLNEGIGNFVFYMKVMLAAVAFAVLIVQGIRLILVIKEGEDETGRAKKNLINAFFGIAVVLLLDPLVNAFFPGAGTVGLSDEVRGFATFLLTLFGAAAVLSFIVAGIFLIVSVDEGLKDRAKKACLTAAIATAVVMAAYVLVEYVLSL